MKPPSPLRTVADIVKAFGGPKSLSIWAGVGKSAVSNWISDNDIPTGWHYRMHLELTARGFEIDPRAFGVVPAKTESALRGKKAGDCRRTA